MKKNSGFTLIELIVVIAIIAVLAVVLAPQYLQYIERGRESNDVQVAQSIIDAVQIAIVDPTSEISAGEFIEMVWVTGDESTGYTKGSLIIRYTDGWRVSEFSDNDGINDVKAGEGDISELEKFAANVFAIIGDDVYINERPDWLQVEFQDAQSKLANEGNLSLHFNTTTGQAAIAAAPSTTVDANRWLEFGLNALPYDN